MYYFYIFDFLLCCIYQTDLHLSKHTFTCKTEQTLPIYLGKNTIHKYIKRARAHTHRGYSHTHICIRSLSSCRSITYIHTHTYIGLYSEEERKTSVWIYLGRPTASRFLEFVCYSLSIVTSAHCLGILPVLYISTHVMFCFISGAALYVSTAQSHLWPRMLLYCMSRNIVTHDYTITVSQNKCYRWKRM